MTEQNQIGHQQAPIVSVKRMVDNKLDFDDSAGQYSYDACMGIQLKHQSE